MDKPVIILMIWLKDDKWQIKLYTILSKIEKCNNATEFRHLNIIICSIK